MRIVAAPCLRGTPFGFPPARAAREGLSLPRSHLDERLSPMSKDRLDDLEQARQSVTASAPYSVSQRYMLPHHMVTTAFAIDGYRVVRTLGVVRGITVRSRSIFGTLGGTLQTIVGGNIRAFTT